jgi:hypothetical protein
LNELHQKVMEGATVETAFLAFWCPSMVLLLHHRDALGSYP